MVTRRDVSGAVGSLAAARDRQRHEQQRRPAQLRQHRRRRATNFARAILLLSAMLVFWWRVCAVLPQAVDRITAINSQPPHLYLFLRSLSAPQFRSKPPVADLPKSFPSNSSTQMIDIWRAKKLPNFRYRRNGFAAADKVRRLRYNHPRWFWTRLRQRSVYRE